MNLRTKQLLAYIVSKNPDVSVTSLMKLSYLVDLISVKRRKTKISDFEYIRYFYGPFDNSIYGYLEFLSNEKVLIPKSDYSHLDGNEFVTYSFNKKAEGFKFDKLTGGDISIIDELIDSVKGYGAKALTEIAYKTKPMRALRATLGGTENLNKKLNLSL